MDAMTIDTKLQPGEALWLYRKRRKLSVTQAAMLFNVSRSTYLACENNNAGLVGKTILPNTPELLRALRRRSGMHRDALASMLGVSHVTWLKWEREADPRIVAFWEKYPWPESIAA